MTQSTREVPRALHDRHVGAGAGCGIVADSEPVNEYQETELKLSGMQASIRVRDAVMEPDSQTRVSTTVD
ncbi:salicylate biosynthesis isochorismate synthase [Burkholderia contaminans]|nr:salicylate biosynthesis isochorismate synthase [Burkholderia contaminans]VWD08446.1 salicylate biosynthesis isochorismate synthase [Burkholderia contaminans]